MPKIFAIGLVSSTNPNQCSVPLLMSKYDANAVQMCGKHGKCRIYSHIYKPYVKVK